MGRVIQHISTPKEMAEDVSAWTKPGGDNEDGGWSLDAGGQL